MHIFDNCSVSSIEHVIAQTIVLLFLIVVEKVSKVINSKIDALHDNFLPVVLFRTTVNLLRWNFPFLKLFMA